MIFSYVVSPSIPGSIVISNRIRSTDCCCMCVTASSPLDAETHYRVRVKDGEYSVAKASVRRIINK